MRFNQPAGHLEAGESLPAAVARRCWKIRLSLFVSNTCSAYRWHSATQTPLICALLSPAITGHDPGRPLDTGILQAVWLSPGEIRATLERHRSPLVSRCVEDYLTGKRYPLGC